MALKPVKNLLIGSLLLERGLITPEQLEAALKEQEKTKEFLGAIITRLGFLKEEEFYPVLAQRLGVEYVRLNDIKVDPVIIEKVPAKFACHYKVMPILMTSSTLTVAMSNPLDILVLDDMRLLLNLQIKPVLASQSEISEAIRKYYGVGAETLERMVEDVDTKAQSPSDSSTIEDLEVAAEDASIVNFVNQILMQAVSERVTDIHMEPFEGELRVRFRIDGVLYDAPIPANIKYFHSAIVSRVKIMSRLDISEHRLAQDGRIKIKIKDTELDLRVSIIPSIYGETVHLRILGAQSLLELEKLGFSKDGLQIIEAAIKKPHGVIFVTGPTGSGKTTTLYACLEKINSNQIKIITIEDPIEYQMRGITQMQVVPKIGFSFANGLRSILRHDPDIIMVGEVRDYETAEITIRSALTGHLVLSTLHTNDSAGAITRLIDMGVEPFLVSSSLECVIAQRLVRLLCPKCKSKTILLKEALKDFDVEDLSSRIEAYEAKGCEACRFTGYYGRTGIEEILQVNLPIKDLILLKASAHQIKKKAVELGMRTLKQDGFEKVLKGLTTVAEVLRVAQSGEE